VVFERELVISDLGLVRRAVGGDAAAFADLVSEHETELVRLCFVITGDAQLAAEAVQNAWQHAWQRRSQLRNVDRFRTWIVAIAANDARMVMRHERRRETQERSLDEARLTNEAPSSDTNLADAMATLSPTDRQLLALRYVAGYNSGEIGKVLGLTGSGARTRLAKAIANLRKELRS